MQRPCGVFDESYAQDMAIVRTNFQWFLLIGLLVFLVVLPFVPFLGRGDILSLINRMAIAVVAVLGLNILTGYCGQISLGHAAFVGVGAYTTAILMVKAGFPFWLTLPCAGLLTGLVGVFFGLPALRVKGLYLALVTIGAQFILRFVFMNWRSMTGGTDGILVPVPTLFGIPLGSDRSFYYVIMAITVLMVVFAKNIVRTRVGRAFIAIRDNDHAAEVMGINLFYYKLLAFFTGCFYAGIAGSLWAGSYTSVHPDHFTLMESIFYLGMVIIGGMGSIGGSIYGALFVKIFDHMSMIAAPMLAAAVPAVGLGAAAGVGKIAFGLIIVLFLVFEPRGLAHRWEIFKASYRLHPFSY